MPVIRADHVRAQTQACSRLTLFMLQVDLNDLDTLEAFSVWGVLSFLSLVISASSAELDHLCFPRDLQLATPVGLSDLPMSARPSSLLYSLLPAALSSQ